MTNKLWWACAAAAVLALAGCASGPAAVPAANATADTAADSGRNTISAQGIGTVTATPDTLLVTLGVETQSESSATALAENSRLATDVIATLKAGGVAEADLQTSQLSIYPTYETNGNQVTGYRVTNMVTAKLRDLGSAGAVIDAVSAAASDAVRVQGLYFTIDDDTALRATARAAAVVQAKAQAQQLADAAGVTLGAIHLISEASQGGGFPYYASAAMDSAAGAPVPLQAGSQDITVSVDVVFDIAQ